MIDPSPYDIASLALSAAALAITYRQHRLATRRAWPRATCRSQPLEDNPGWHRLDFEFLNLSTTPLFVDFIKVPFWSGAKLIDPLLWQQPLTPWDTFKFSPRAELATRRVQIDLLVPADTRSWKSLLVLRKSKTTLPMFRWADSTSYFSMQIQIT